MVLVSQCVELITVTTPGGVAQVFAPSSSPCSGGIVLSQAEYDAIQASPLNLSAEDGLTLSVAIVGVWAVAWCVRALVHTLNSDGEVRE